MNIDELLKQLNLSSKLNSPWMIAIAVIIPAVILFTGWVIKRRAAAGRPTTAPKVMRYLVLPTLVTHIFIRFVMGVGGDEFITKTTETILSLSFLVFLFNAINYLFFSEHNILTKEETIPKLGRDVLNFALTMIFGSVVLSSVWGIHLASLLAALGVGSLVIGLALQEPLGNLFTGISLLMAQPFRKGDWIQIGDEKGKVKDFNWRSVKIVNRNNVLVVIPNNMIGKETIKNLSRPSRVHAVLISIGFSYSDNPAEVKEALLELAIATDGVLNVPAPQPLTLSYDDFYITYGLKFYIRDFADEIALKDRVMSLLFDMAADKQFTIPFPIRDVRMQQAD